MSDAYYDAQLKNDITRNVRQYRDLDLFFTKKTESKDVNVKKEVVSKVLKKCKNVKFSQHLTKSP